MTRAAFIKKIWSDYLLPCVILMGLWQVFKIIFLIILAPKEFAFAFYILMFLVGFFLLKYLLQKLTEIIVPEIPESIRYAYGKANQVFSYLEPIIFLWAAYEAWNHGLMRNFIICMIIEIIILLQRRVPKI